VARTLADLARTFGSNRRIAIARELTKLHEEVWRGTLGDALAWASDEPRGEMVLVVEGAPAAEPPDDDALLDALRARLALGASVKDASAEVATRFGVSRRAVYELAHTLPRAPR
jgi:16S rRNA (cytidine1402-2'-O)-methyltransferase